MIRSKCTRVGYITVKYVFSQFLRKKATTNIMSSPALTEKVAIITGTATGIGAATAKHFAKAGYKKLALVDIKEDGLKKTAEECRKEENVEILEIVVDLSDEAEARSVVGRTVDHFGRIDVLVNNAGIALEMDAAFRDQTVSAANKIMAVNYFAPFILSQAAIPYLEKTRGNIVFTSSVLSQKPFKGMAAYCSTKAAINMLSKTIALEEGAKGIRSNVVWPAVIATNIHLGVQGPEATGYKTFIDLDDIRSFDAYKSVHAVNRVGEPEEVARAIAFLADADSAFITGAQLAVDGGALML